MRQQSVSKSRQRAFVSHHELLGRHLNHGLAVGVSDHEVDGQSQEVVLGCGHVCNWLLTKPKTLKSFLWLNGKLFSIHLTQKTETQKNLTSADEIATEKLQQFVHPPTVVMSSKCEECNQAVYALFGSPAPPLGNRWTFEQSKQRKIAQNFPVSVRHSAYCISMRSRNGSCGTGSTLFDVNTKETLFIECLTTWHPHQSLNVQLLTTEMFRKNFKTKRTCPFTDTEKKIDAVRSDATAGVHGRVRRDFNQGLYSKIVEKVDLTAGYKWFVDTRSKKVRKAKNSTVKWIRLHETFLRCHSTQHKQLIHDRSRIFVAKSWTLHCESDLRYAVWHTESTEYRDVQTVSVYDLFPRKISTVCKATQWQP